MTPVVTGRAPPADGPHHLDPRVDPSVIVGATSTSHPAAADDVDINRSGSGGTGGGDDDPVEDLS